jgi:protocatechuate 3,4-dioxygenase beta subunit
MALKVKRAAARGARCEGQVRSREPADPLSEVTGRELLAVLDAELLKLPELLRAPLVLCYLEGLTRDEAAARLGCALAALKKRLERGRERLHRALVRRGFGFPAALLGLLLVDRAAPALPGTLARQLTDAVPALAAGKKLDGVISARVLHLVHGGARMTGRNRLWVALGVLLLGGLLASAVALASNAADDRPPPKQPAPPGPGPAAEVPAAPTPARVLRVTVLDHRGKPLSGAKIHASIWTAEKDFKKGGDVETDTSGVARVELPKSLMILRLWVGKKSFTTMFANWERAELAGGTSVPTEYTFRLEPAVSAGGRILDEQGKPVAGARVQVRLPNVLKPPKSDGRVRYDPWLAQGNDAVTTDAEGRWRIETVPDQPGVQLALLVSHPDYVVVDGWTRPAAGADIETAKMLEGTATLTLKPGVIVRGRVTDPDGKPIKDALVVHGDQAYFGFLTSTFVTDKDGRFRLPALPPGRRSLTVIAAGWAPQMRKLDFAPDLPAQEFRLQAGKLVRLVVVDGEGRAIPDAEVTLTEWKGSSSIVSKRNPNHPKVPDAGIPKRTNAEGVWEWPSAPDEPVLVEIYVEGFQTHRIVVTGGGPARTVTFTRGPR